MSTTFNLTNTATDVNTAIQAVVGADTAPTDGSVNMVTSDGVFTYVGTQLGGLAGKTITTESTGIAATDNDDSIPTSAAVKTYVDTAQPSTVVGCGSFEMNSSSNYYVNSSAYIPLTADNTFSIGQVGSVSGTTITLPAGTYFVQPNFTVHSTTGGTWDLSLQQNNSDILKVRASTQGDSERRALAGGVFVTSTSPQTIRIYATEVTSGSLVLPSGALNPTIVISRLF